MTPEALEEALTEKTKLLIFCNPDNPTGCVYSKKEIESFREVSK